MAVFKIILSDLLFISFKFLVMLIQSKQDREPLSALALVCLCPAGPHSMFLLTIPKQDQEYLSAPCSNCLCQAGASSRSVGTMQTEECYT